MSPYPAVAFQFEVRISGDATQAHAAFAEVSGLDVERSVEEISEGGENGYVHRVPGRIKHGNLVLKRGIVGASDPLFEWCKSALESDLALPLMTKSIEVSLLDANRSPLITWVCASAWPVKWAIAGFDAIKGQVAMETLEFSYTRVRREYETDYSGVSQLFSG